VDHLAVTVSNESASASQTFDLDGRPFPVTFTVTPDGRAGALRVAVSALDADDGLRGVGEATADIVADAQVDMSVLLDPTDFPINQDIAGTQRLTFRYESAGGQLAASGDGFYATFINDCMTLGRCDVLARRFDGEGVPAVNDTTMDDGDFIANLTDEYTDVPTLAATDATVLVAWETTDAIKSVALSAAGAHQGVETILSSSTLLEQTPAATALATGEFVVVWVEAQMDGSETIRGRLLSAAGLAIVNPITGTDLDFEVSAPEPGFASVPDVAATGTGRGFVAVWKYADDFLGPSNVRARFFTQTGTPTSVSNARITSFTAGDVYGPKVVPTGTSRAVIAFTAETADDPRLVDGGLVIGRYNAPGGSAEGAPIVQPLSIPSAFQAPVPAMALRSDGAIGVAWHGCGGDGDGQGCGVLARLVRPSGMPVGEAVAVNTTLPGDQETPSIAALPDAFVVAWTDGSLLPPDTDQLGIRGRLVYLPGAATDGRHGARCGEATDAPCAAGLACVSGNEGTPLCHHVCDPADVVACPRGGACTTVGEDSACIY
jgi:hypothetical protein